MRYLWRMSVSGKKVVFKYTDWTQKKEAESFNNLDFYTDKYLVPEDPSYAPIVQETRNLCSILEIGHVPSVEIMTGFQKTVVFTDKVLFNLLIHDGAIKLSTENNTAFSFAQIQAIFDFASTLIQYGWL